MKHTNAGVNSDISYHFYTNSHCVLARLKMAQLAVCYFKSSWAFARPKLTLSQLFWTYLHHKFNDVDTLERESVNHTDWDTSFTGVYAIFFLTLYLFFTFCAMVWAFAFDGCRGTGSKFLRVVSAQMLPRNISWGRAQLFYFHTEFKTDNSLLSP